MRVVATAGHVDHGKSTLLRALTGMEPDRWAEERRRGLTLDLGFVWADLHGSHGATRTVAFVDVPGHQRFIANMLAGAGTAPAVLFVVAADDGWNAQTHEHRDILDLLAVPAAAVAITKAERVTAARVDDVVAATRTELAGTSLAGAPIVVTDAVSDRGLDDLERALVDRLATLPAPPDRDRPHLWVDRCFSLAGAGTIVTGTLADGWLALGDELRVLPGDATTRARGLQALGRDVDRAGPGSRVAVNLAGIGHDEVARGDLVVPAGQRWPVTDRVDVALAVLDGHHVTTTGDWHVHVGSAAVAVEVLPLLGDVDGGSTGPARLRLATPMPLAHDTRMVLRDAGRRTTVAGVRVLDPTPGRRPRGSTARLARAEVLESLEAATSPAEVVAGLLDARGGAGRRADVLAAAGFPSAGDDVVGATPLGDHLVDADSMARWGRAVVEQVDGADPAVGGDVHEAVASATTAGCPDGLAGALVDRLVETGRLVRHGQVVVTPERDEAWRGARDARRTGYLEALRAGGLQPPDPQGLAASWDLQARDVAALVDRGAIVRAGSVVFAADAIEQAGRDLADAFPDEPFSASRAGEVLATTRKHTIPILERLAFDGVLDFDGARHRLATSEPSG